MKQVLMTMFLLLPTAGGITRVIMNRSRMFREVGVNAEIALLGFDPDLLESLRWFKAEGRLAEQVPVYNLYAYYQTLTDDYAAGRGAPSQPPTVESCGYAPGEDAVRVEHDPSTGIQTSERYLTPAGRCFLIRYPGTPDPSSDSVTLIDPETGEHRRFEHMDELYAHWLKELSVRHRPSVLIADSPFAAGAVLRARGEGHYGVLTIHGHHFAKPFKYGSKLRVAYKDVLRTYKEADALAILTSKQRDHIEMQFGSSPNVEVIPNSVTVFGNADSEIVRDPNLVVVVGRYSKVKRIALIIRAFKSVVKKVPEGRLSIYGSGFEEENLQALVGKLGLEDSVTVNGYVGDPSSIYRRATVSAHASEAEGFGLTIAESLSLGTPAVSIDCDYGPREIITHGKDGYLVEDEKQLTNRLVELLQNPTLARQMGEAGSVNMSRFSEDNIRDQWLELFRKMQATAPSV